ncbi:MAG TPA: ATP-binding protein [Tepidiformaceae bacterium]
MAFEDFFQNGAVPMHWVAPDGTIIRANNAELDLAGYERDEYVGRPIFGFHEDPGAIEHLLERLRAGEVVRNFPSVIVRKDGTKRHVLIDSSAYFEDGKIVHTRCFTRDVTAERRREAAVERRESWFRSLFDRVPITLYTLTADGRVDFVNGTRYDGSRNGRAFIWGERAIHPTDVRRVRRRTASGIRSGRPFDIEFRLRGDDGRYRYHLARYVPVTDEDGTLTGWVGTSMQIDEQKRAQESQRFLGAAGEVLSRSLDVDVTLTSLARLSISHLAEGCSIELLNPEGRIESVAVAHQDPHIEELLGQIRRRNPPAVGGPHAIARAISSWEPVNVQIDEHYLAEIAMDEEHLVASRSLDATWSLSVPLIARGRCLGAITLYRSASSPRFDDDEVRVAVDLARRAALAIDNAELFRASQQVADELLKANRVKDEFLGLVSHELRTPLTTIIGNADVLRRRGAEIDPEHLRTASEDIQHDAERLYALVKNMLVLSHVEAERDVIVEPTLVQRVLPRVVATHSARFPEREILTHLEPGLGAVLAQESYLEQILGNLISNAEKYAPAGTPITVIAQPKDDHIAIAVLDRGQGIAPDDLDKIFKPFFRSERSAATAGAGLGLAVCQRLVEVQGGQIWAQPRQGGGTEFWFTLPVAHDG